MSTDQGVDHCAFYIERKKRFCRFKPNTGQKYCAEHTGLLGIPTNRKRIVCPLNRKHTCYEDQLSKHLKKCRKQQAAFPLFYSGYNLMLRTSTLSGINAGESPDQSEDNTSKMSLLDIPTEELKQLILKINRLFDENVKISSDILSHSCLNEELSNSLYGIPAIKQRKQQASLIGHLDKMGLIKDGTTYVELGAGKGMLSHWIQKAGENNTNSKFILVDRGTCRYKADNFHKWEDNGPKFERIRIDIEHLYLGKVETISLSDSPVVAVGKHLCGSATDLAFRCVTQTLLSESEEEPTEKKQKGIEQSGKFGGLSIALCCHHRCLWKPYVGKSFFLKNGLSERDFQILCKLSSWTAATWSGWKSVQEMNSALGLSQIKGGDDSKNQISDELCKSESNLEKDKDLKTDEVDHSSSEVDDISQDDVTDNTEQNIAKRTDLNLSVKEREEIGRKCKRLIDYGRLEYLKDQGLHCDMKVYIEEQLTPENVAIFAQPIS